VAKHIIGENSTVEKEYLVRVTGELSERGLALLNHGLSLDGEALKPAEVAWQNEDQLRFVLREGKKRQIRRMCELVGCAWWVSSVSVSAPSSWVICPPDSGAICVMTRCSDPPWQDLGSGATATDGRRCALHDTTWICRPTMTSSRS
jgi:hypothetical protein